MWDKTQGKVLFKMRSKTIKGELMKHCTKCGAKLTKDDLFCPECGEKTRHEKKQEKPKEKVK